MTLAWIIGSGLVAGIGGVLVAGLFLCFPDRIRAGLLPDLVSYATGSLLATALLGLVPHALEAMPLHQTLLFVLAGILLFFILEKLVILRHCHDHACESHQATVPLILIGDGVHNFIDGVIIASAFLTSTPLGIATAIAAIAHEIPQEVGDFAILLEGGMKRGTALLWNGVSGLSTLAGSLIAFFVFERAAAAVPAMMAIAAAGFLYIAMSDLVPHLHRRTSWAAAVRQVVFIAIGILTIMLLHLHG